MAGAVVGPRLHHAVREGAELGGEVLLGEALVGAGVDVPDEDAGAQFDAGGHGGGRGAGEDLDLDVEVGEALGQLHDVDVHAMRRRPCRAGAGGGVHGEHGHAAGAAGHAQARGGSGCRSTPEPADVLAHGGESSLRRAGGGRARGAGGSWRRGGWARGPLRLGRTPERSAPFPVDGSLPNHYRGSLNRSRWSGCGAVFSGSSACGYPVGAGVHVGGDAGDGTPSPASRLRGGAAC